MNKRINTLLFVLGASVFNVITVIVSFILLALIFYRLVPNTENSWVFPVILIASLAISFFVYRVILKYLLKKIDIEKYFDPIFARKYKKPPAPPKA